MKGFLTLLFIVLLAVPCGAATITLVADEWPPFNGVAGSEAEGYMVDIARTIFESRGFEVEYITMPWKRALSETRQGTYTAAVGASKTDAVGFVFPEQELARNTLAFYVKKGNPWRFEGIASIQNVALGVISGYDYRQWLNEYIAENLHNSDRVQVLAGDIPLQRSLQRLLFGRIDVVVDTEAAILWEAKRLGFLDKIENAGYGDIPSYCYIAFSPSIPESQLYAEILSDGITQLRSSGKLQDILNKYGLTDWQSM